MRSSLILSLNVSIATQKPSVLVGEEFPFGDQPPEGCFHQLLAFVDVVEDLGSKVKEARVDPVVSAADILNAADNSIGVALHCVKTLRGANGSGPAVAPLFFTRDT